MAGPKGGREFQTEVSDKQQEVYDALIEWVSEHRYQPSTRELVEKLNVHPASLSQRMQLLERKRMVTDLGRSRGAGLPGIRFKRVLAPTPRS